MAGEWISAAFGLAGVILGGGISLVGQSFKDRRDIENESRLTYFRKAESCIEFIKNRTKLSSELLSLSGADAYTVFQKIGQIAPLSDLAYDITIYFPEHLESFKKYCEHVNSIYNGDIFKICLEKSRFDTIDEESRRKILVELVANDDQILARMLDTAASLAPLRPPSIGESDSEVKMRSLMSLLPNKFGGNSKTGRDLLP